MALDATSSQSPVHCSILVEPVQQGNWVTVRWPSRGSKHHSFIPIKNLTGSPHSVRHPLRNLMKVL